MSWSRVDTECSIHWAHHPPRIVCLHFISKISSWPLNAAWLRCASLYNRPPSASSPSELNGNVTFPWMWDNELMITVSAPGAPSIDCLQVLVQPRSITDPKCISKLARLRPASSNDHGLQVHIQTRSITACKFAWSWPRSSSTNSLDYDLGLHLQIHLVAASKSSLNSLDHSLGVYLWVHGIIIFRRTSHCSQAPPAASPDIPCVDT